MSYMSLGPPSPLVQRLWIGPVPPPGETLKRAGFDVVVLCAEELQFNPAYYPGVQIIHAPLDDSGPPITKEERAIALDAADRTADLYRRGAKIAVTCHMGVNRSGLVSALTLRRLFGLSGADARRCVQKMRPGTLKNASFVAWLNELP